MLDDPAADLRTRLLESALTLISEQGASGLTVRAVAKAAGCSTMGVYTHFNGKSGLIDAVVEQGFDTLNDVLAEAWEGAGPGRDGLIATAEAYRDWAFDAPAQFQTMFAPAIAGYEPSERTRERTWDTFFAHRARVASALDSADADPAAWHDATIRLWSWVHGHVAVELMSHAYANDAHPAMAHSDLSVAVDAEIERAAVAVTR
ncbi:TetR/AcrR family transcriptional regulator [Demequina sp. SYSU T00192]|uniref:TetR/AcrR family transcriptional regulator n=1 Tax=Demequina litoralis TaxID=3051660 RepID=A0ABT8G833_9MICO|nr:TetR/AcrR family transcriptional regulator [Demequina sp. SYSU T00192]MDN4475296.1 TetR/AcrR family transcriptional regulator [Demequina sp. SYSU T00192]